MSNCCFCEAIPKRVLEVDRTQLFVAQWDGYPVTPGHMLIIPFRHVRYLEELSADECHELFIFAQKMVGYIKTASLAEIYAWHRDEFEDTASNIVEYVQAQAAGKLPPQSFTIGLNNGPDAGQTVPHLHLHLIPRWPGDVDQPRGGIRNIFPNDMYKDLLT